MIRGYVDATDFLLAKVYNYKIRDTETNLKGESLAHLAAKHGHVDILRLLAKHKINLSLHNSDGHTPLQVATSEGKLGAMAELGFYHNQITVPPVMDLSNESQRTVSPAREPMNRGQTAVQLAKSPCAIIKYI